MRTRESSDVTAMDVNAEVQIRAANKPVDGIQAEAHAGGYDLIVGGSHGPQARSAFSADDVTMQTVATANCSVLVIPPAEF
jgi:nucleotide-binding universal stress UspA family protein